MAATARLVIGEPRGAATAPAEPATKWVLEGSEKEYYRPLSLRK